jgi:hypothetical protein
MIKSDQIWGFGKKISLRKLFKIGLFSRWTHFENFSSDAIMWQSTAYLL